ncbi:MAG: hypothetical protein LBH74_09415 [Nitrososphaerota archaeon]|jgi:hypothetical protein|nr:hypothetical protein [Nitrososphaerota archaeon]
MYNLPFNPLINITINNARIASVDTNYPHINNQKIDQDTLHAASMCDLSLDYAVAEYIKQTKRQTTNENNIVVMIRQKLDYLEASTLATDSAIKIAPAANVNPNNTRNP